MAEEAIGLARSLSWDVIYTPQLIEYSTRDFSEFVQQEEQEEKQTAGRKIRSKTKAGPDYHEGYDVDGEKIQEGDYVYGPAGVRGIFTQGQISIDFDAEENDDEWYDEWENTDKEQAKASITRVRTPDAATFFRKGKIEELRDIATANRATYLFVNYNISPTQQRNIERSLSTGDNTVRIIDRFGIILKIFSERAKTKLAKLQLQLAWLKYIKARIVRGGGSTFGGLHSLFHGGDGNKGLVEMEVVSGRQGSYGKGIGGSGEKQLEVERRQIKDKEAELKKKIISAQKKRRALKDPNLTKYATISIIGYTNAGKTALMNYLTGEKLVSEDLLFQTLSTTARQLMLPEEEHAAVIDTVGFISDLPHDLVEAFKATLEGSQNADILLHVRDISHPYTELQRHTVIQVLEELEIDWKSKYVEVWNKVDLLETPIDLDAIESADYPVIPISAKHGINCDRLLNELTQISRSVLGKELTQLKFPLDEYQIRTQWLRENANILTTDYNVDVDQNSGDETVVMDVYLDPNTLSRYKSYFDEELDQRERRGMPSKEWLEKKFGQPKYKPPF